MRLSVIANGGCTGGTCPTVYATDRGTVVVQGKALTDEEALAQVAVPDGEALVEVSIALLVEAVRGVGGG